jgi:hypothetical protein
MKTKNPISFSKIYILITILACIVASWVLIPISVGMSIYVGIMGLLVLGIYIKEVCTTTTTTTNIVTTTNLEVAVDDTYAVVRWPDVQVLMDYKWFKEETILIHDSASDYLVPIKYLHLLNTANETVTSEPTTIEPKPIPNLLECNGKKFSAKIIDSECSGIVSVEGNSVYLCQNEFDGTECSNKFDYRFSRTVYKGTTEDLLRACVTDLIILD